MKDLIKKDWLIWIILLAPFVVLALYWNQFPEQVPIHWNIRGEVDNYSNKYFGLLFPPLLNIGLYFLFKALPYIDPKRSNYEIVKDKLGIVQLITHTFVSALAVVTAFISLGYNLQMDVIAKYGVVLLLLLLGNYLSAIRPNYFIGIKTPWTLSNDEVWTKTHRLTGKLWVFSSLFMLLYFLLFPFNEVLFIIYIIVLVAIPFLYSFLLYRKLQGSKK